MSRYEELCNAYKKYSDDRIAFVERSKNFITKFVNEFLSFLDAPENQVRFFHRRQIRSIRSIRHTAQQPSEKMAGGESSSKSHSHKGPTYSINLTPECSLR
jgi:hypothetical protein